ncbi:MAG: YkgJ family cysteine cluster protein [Candidatus Xenobia bacterium]
MSFRYLPGQNFDCNSCGRCCRSTWRILVDPKRTETILHSDVGHEVEAKLGRTPIRDGVTVHDGTACAFLSADRLCSIHARLGADAKPLGCQQFPFLLTDTPDGTYVGASFYCPTVQQNQGRPLAEHEADLAKLPAKPIGFLPIPLGPGHHVTWAEYRGLEASLVERLAEEAPDIAVGRVLTAVCLFLVHQGNLQDRLHSLPPHPPALLHLGTSFERLVIGTLSATTPEEAPQQTEALSSGGMWRSRHFNWEGPAQEVHDARDRIGNSLDAEITRYLRALVFRKFLALDRPILDNLITLYLVPRLVRFYAAVSMLSRPATQWSDADWDAAVSHVERRVVSHIAPEAYFPIFSETCLAVARLGSA